MVQIDLAASNLPSECRERDQSDSDGDETSNRGDLREDGSPRTNTLPSSKKKKKKRKTPAQKKAAALAREQAQNENTPAQPVLKISRNKHMKYISSYHGPWLQLPHEVLDTLLAVNCDPSALPTVRGLVDPPSQSVNMDRARFHAIAASPHDRRSPSPPPLPKFPIDEGANFSGASPGNQLPSPIDPAVFRGVSHIRKLVDEASDLAVRAAVGMSAAALGSFGAGGGGAPPLSAGNDASGRHSSMSPVRQHRLRVLAVARLAEAYRVDEIAASVAVMQGATGLDDLAQRVLKIEPDNLDAQYVHFHHEKIPSRTLATSTNTTQLDHLIASDPQRLEYLRTRGVVHGFKQDYNSAVRDFTQALNSAKSIRKEKELRDELKAGGTGSKKKKSSKGGKGANKHTKSSLSNGDGFDSDTANGSMKDLPTASTDPSMTIGKEPGDDLERQVLFHRAMAHFHHACKLMEDTALDVEGVEKPPGGLSNEGGELTLRNIGIILSDETAGLYGNASREQQIRFETEMGDPSLRKRIATLLRKSVADHERFLTYFRVWEAPPGNLLEEEDRNRPTLGARQTDRPLTFRGRRLIHHRALAQRTRDADPRRAERQKRHQDIPPPAPALLTTYHPLIIESHFSVLLNLLLLGDFSALVPAHARTVRLMDHLEGYPAFLPARSLTMSEYAEVLERLSITWRVAREASGTPAPDLDLTEAELAEQGTELECLHQLTGFFSTEFVEALIRQAERERRMQEDKEQSLLNKTKNLALENGSTGKAKAITQGGEADMIQDDGDAPKRASWKEERDKADAERRKIDPSYATYNTARAEVALTWLQAVIIPEKEREEKLNGKTSSKPQPLSRSEDDLLSASTSSGAKGKGKGKSTSFEDDLPEPSTISSSSFVGITNSSGLGGSRWNGASGSGSGSGSGALDGGM